MLQAHGMGRILGNRLWLPKPGQSLHLQEWEVHRGMPELYLEGSAVHGCQLSLVVEHLLKVRDMPVLVGGVAVKPLQRPREDVSTPHFQGVTGTYPKDLSYLTDVVMDAPMGHHLEGVQSHLQCPGTFWSCSVQGPVREQEIQIHWKTGRKREAVEWDLPPQCCLPHSRPQQQRSD